MRAMRRAVFAGWMVVGAVAQAGCGDSGSSTTGVDTTSGSGGTGADGGGGATSAGGTGGAGASTGTGGAGAGLPFDSKGTSSYEAEATIAASGDGGVVAAWIAFFADNTSAIGYVVSHDDGGTWTAPAYVKSPGGLYASQPVVAADGQGRFVLAWAGFGLDSAMPDEHVYVARLDAGADVFGAPILASDDGASKTRDFDKPWLAVDANDNTLVTWADFTGFNGGTPPSLTFARSADGTTFTRTTVTADATFGNLAYPCLDVDAGPAAPLYMVHLGANATVSLRASADQGKTWALHDTPATDVLFQDVTCVVKGSDVWIGYASGTAPFVPGESQPADAVEVIHSGNGGQTFDAPVTVTTAGSGDQYLFPQLALTPGGQLAIAYYQGVVNGSAELVLATSSEGTAWSGAVIASPGSFIVDRTHANWLGDYMGLARTEKAMVLAYGDNTEGKTHISFAKIAQ